MIRAIGFAAALGCFAATPALAQALPGSIEVGGGMGRFYGGSFQKGSNREFSQKVEVDDDILKGFSLGAQLTRTWGLEVALRKSQEDIVQPQSGVFPDEPTLGSLEVTTVEIAAIRSFPIGQFAPYLAAGGGVSNLNINVPNRSVRDVNRFGVSLAVGARFYAFSWIGLRVDARTRATYLGRRRVGDGGWTDGGRWFRNSEILGEAFVSFPAAHSR